ncbi:hypothetical protein M422DRAFT_266593 [Sphaerobolus stellatus SS14]|uniref:Helitron helicase-like domain-containing protein n=1 Tax=Sphaerobolus stellatus (strain SS14) TaxID=990650 RepID=A0A0C9TNS6_SPHS4|nr:hypothetical protein M422DRAFT_266593 [Sphaerobolus stellatus SS14]
MPLSRGQQRERNRQHRQDERYREQARLAAAQHRARRRQTHTTSNVADSDNNSAPKIEQQSEQINQGPHTENNTPWWITFKQMFHHRRRGLCDDLTWDRTCQHCGARLLKGERAGFCCNNGKKIVPPLPQLPPQIWELMNNAPILANKISSYSRSLNNLFAFTAIGTTGRFVRFETGTFSVAITGRTYHRILDVAQHQSSIHWFLYDEHECEQRGQQYNVPAIWIRSVRADLEEVNPYVNTFRLFQNVNEEIPAAIELTEASTNGDFAAIIHAGNIAANVQPRSVLIWRNSENEPSFMPIYSRHYEPLQYLLLFPHGTLGWGLPNNTRDLNIDADDENVLGFTQMQWYRNRLLTDDRFLRFGRLASEYICDMYSRIEEQ